MSNFFLKGTCKYDQNTKPRYAAANGFVIVQNNMINIQAALITQGPLSIGINAGLSTFIFYSSGVYQDTNCSPNALNHAGKNQIVNFLNNFYIRYI